MGRDGGMRNFFKGFFGRLGPCKWEGCTNQTTKIYCDWHALIRAQHSESHKLEGHSNSYIERCPACESEQFNARVERKARDVD